MSAEAPILIIQMQRMGDMVMSFPLLLRLQQAFPQREAWVLGEQIFFKPLLPLSPTAVYFDVSAAHKLKHTHFSAVINLSHRPESAVIAAQFNADSLYGSYTSPHDGNRRIRGFWHLYRHSIMGNNRHNLYHWSDLNALDAVPATTMLVPVAPPSSVWPTWRVTSDMAEANGRIGLFVGASETDKRPEPLFWASLAGELLRRGFKPVFLGGPMETALAAQAAELLGQPHLNLAGKFTVQQLGAFLQGLKLLVTPDTGPMHVAAWRGTPVLNISVGPVNPWETAPSQPGHAVLRGCISCNGCWQCTRRGIPCKQKITPGMAANACELILENRSTPFSGAARLWQTARDASGLFDLTQHHTFSSTPLNPSRMHISRFWQAFFMHASKNFGQRGGSTRNLSQPDAALSVRACRAFCENGLAAYAMNWLKPFHMHLAHATAKKDARALLLPDLWRDAPPCLRPWSGFARAMLQNEDFSHNALRQCLELTEQIVQLIQ